MHKFPISRRSILKQLAAVSGGLLTLNTGHASAATTTRLFRTIPSTGERIPAIGMGTWITFNVGYDPELIAGRSEVLRMFFEMGGSMVDSSPMCGSAEAVMGYCLERLGAAANPLFSATKVWTSSIRDGQQQIDDSHRLWGIDRFDLFQVHNLVNWRGHLPRLLDMKEEGRLRYVGIISSQSYFAYLASDLVRTSWTAVMAERLRKCLHAANVKSCEHAIKPFILCLGMRDRIEHVNIPCSEGCRVLDRVCLNRYKSVRAFIMEVFRTRGALCNWV